MKLSLEALNKIKDKATKLTENQLPFKLVFVPDGTLFVRFLLDSETEFIRTYKRHKWNNMNIQCLGPDRCKICERLGYLSDPKWDSEYLFRSREVDMAYAWIEDYEDVNVDPSYLHVRQHVLLMGKSSLGEALSNHIADMQDLESIEKAFDPEEKQPVLALSSRGKGSHLIVSELSMKTLAIPPLPESFPPLSQIFFRDDDEPNPRYVNQFISIMERSRREALSRYEW